MLLIMMVGTLSQEDKRQRQTQYPTLCFAFVLTTRLWSASSLHLSFRPNQGDGQSVCQELRED